MPSESALKEGHQDEDGKKASRLNGKPLHDPLEKATEKQPQSENRHTAQENAPKVEPLNAPLEKASESKPQGKPPEKVPKNGFPPAQNGEPSPVVADPDDETPPLVDDEDEFEPDDEPPPLVAEEDAFETEWDMGDHLTPYQKRELQNLLDEFHDVFARSMSEMTTVRGEKFSIPVTNDTPIFRHQYRLSQSEKESLNEHIEERIKCGFIRPSSSPWAFPTTMPPKKDEHGNWTLKRPCGDYRELNKVSVTDHYPLPTPEEIFDQLQSATWFTTLDLRWGYHQVAIDEKDYCKTAFWGPRGLYERVVMPFGLKNAPAFFQRMLDTTLRAQFEFCRCYIDDLIIFSKSFDEHLVHLRAVFEQLHRKRIRCHPPKKMRLAVSDVEYLGHFVVPNGTAPQQAKKDVPWEWSAQAQEAFEQLKVKLTEAPILRRPNYDLPFELHTDWSSAGLGAVLAQRDEEGKEYVVAYASRSNNRTERNYSSYHGECLAAVWGVQIFRWYPYGRHFTLITDHEPLKWLMTNMRLTGMHARWANILQEYEFEIVHRSGLKNLDADGLSRNPLPSDHDPTDARMDHTPSDVSHISACLARLAVGSDNTPSPMPALIPTAPEREPPEVDMPVKLDRDIWHDAPVIEFLRDGTYPPDASSQVRDRIWHRAQGYHFEHDLLRRRVDGGGSKIVLKPDQRANLIRRVHMDIGHFGVKKTYSLLEPTYWWVGMYGQVEVEVSFCVVCDRVKATFEVKDPTLKPLPIMGMFYRWGIDLFKMPVKSTAGNEYVVVMIEHFSKWIEIFAIPAKKAEYVREKFIEVLARFGAPVEVVTDQGSEFEGLFAELLIALYIDHCIS
ncbi:putative retrotransposon protein [Klebsormidium nitens]|uniref:Putative retrotransposon protein n=1 Tax=Klebsormidium nitens TaxID=105231 RepID=A0A1Y1IIJ1_KLENI|nr:putative retrotransposon protein [Klebsormidium nitens]|eukprot:GAQ87978.1 putative retrotransposon protein [Klebsormidium nitens]